MDFSVYAGGVYLFTEAYFYLLGPREANISVFWCLLIVAFSMYPACQARGWGGRLSTATPHPALWSLTRLPKSSLNLGPSCLSLQSAE